MSYTAFYTHSRVHPAFLPFGKKQTKPFLHPDTHAHLIRPSATSFGNILHGHTRSDAILWIGHSSAHIHRQSINRHIPTLNSLYSLFTFYDPLLGINDPPIFPKTEGPIEWICPQIFALTIPSFLPWSFLFLIYAFLSLPFLFPSLFRPLFSYLSPFWSHERFAL